MTYRIDPSRVCVRPYHRSPWWVTTGVVLWFGVWPGIFHKESGEKKNTFTKSVMFPGYFCNMYFLFVWRAVASLNTPMFPVDPSGSLSKKLMKLPTFDYQIYFQKPVSYPVLPWKLKCLIWLWCCCCCFKCFGCYWNKIFLNKKWLD